MMGKEYWKGDGMIYYDEYGEGWGLLKDGSTVCLCGEVDILKVLSGEVSLDTVTNPKQREALETIINYRKEQGYGEQDTDRSIIGSKPTRAFECRKASLRQPALKQKATLHSIDK